MPTYDHRAPSYQDRLAALPDSEIQRLTDYLMAAIFATAGKCDHQLVPIILEQYLEKGFAVLPSNTLAARLNSCRRTICTGRKRLEKAGFIRQIGLNTDGQYACVPLLERADEYRARIGEVRHAA